MTDKERLEEIINNLPYSIRHEGNTEKLIEYAKEQTERVEDNDQAIVDLNKHVEELEDENVDLEQQNKRYRELLEIVIENGQCSTIDNIAKELYK